MNWKSLPFEGDDFGSVLVVKPRSVAKLDIELLAHFRHLLKL
jgi:hypothetical protein